MSITQGEHELQRYFGSFTNNIPIGFIQQVYAASKTVTANGNAKIDTSQSKFGGASGLFGGAGDYLSTPDSSDWAFGTGAFTIDFWARFNSLPANGNYMFFLNQGASGTDMDYFYVTNSAGIYQLGFHVQSGGAPLVDIVRNTSPNLSTGTWYHFAVVRSGNTFYLFQGGSQLGTTVTSTNAVPDFAASLYIGAMFDGTSYCMNGWLDEFRVSKGVARWTSNFTPPTSEYASDSYTVLLLHMDGADGSTTFTDDSATVGPTSFGFNVKSSAIQVVVTLMYSWTGSGAPPQGSITLAAPSGPSCSPSCSESGAVVYDRTSISVSGGGNTYNLIHRVTFAITAPGSAQIWTAYVSLAGVTSYTLTIEVS